MTASTSEPRNRRPVVIDGPVAITACSVGRVIYTDVEDADLLRSASWSDDGRGYPRRGHRGATRRSVRLHEDVMARMADPAERIHKVVDHIDGNKLNNRRSNLRLVARSDNTRALAVRRQLSRINGHETPSRTLEVTF